MYGNVSQPDSPEISGCSRGPKKRKKKWSLNPSESKTVLPQPLSDSYKLVTLSQRKELITGWMDLLKTNFQDDPLETEQVLVIQSEALDDGPFCHVSLLTDSKEDLVVCGVSCDVFPRHSNVLVGYLATHPEYKRQGLASKVWRSSMDILSDSEKLSPNPLLFFAEVSVAPASSSARGYWHAKGFQRLDFTYYLPEKYRKKKSSLEEEYMLTVLTQDPSVKRISASRIMTFLEDFYDWCSDMEDSTRDPGMVSMLEKIEKLDYVDLIDIPE
ncbi:hypothetical protein GEMRC1_007626 [Eukaryota sp. GEM-RC1]